MFGHQYAQEILLESRGKNVRSRKWVAKLPDVIAGLNKEPTKLIGNKTPLEAIKLPEVSSTKSRPKTKVESLLPPGIKVRYLYQPGELESGERRRATDPIWSLDFYEISHVMGKDPNIYYLHSKLIVLGVHFRVQNVDLSEKNY